MSTTSELFFQSELALAAYSSLAAGISGDTYTNALQDRGNGLSAKQADLFAQNYSVVTQYNDTIAEGGLGTSFSATVFEDADGHLTLAIRGTVELAGSPNDLTTDADIFSGGAGYDQIVALYNWWSRETAAPGTTVKQYRWVATSQNPQAIPLNGKWLEPADSVIATDGVLYSAISGKQLEVTGHSLGGHLAMVFASLFPAFTSQVTVFNAPGFKDTTTNQTFFAALDGTVPTGNLVTNIVADEASIGTSPWSAIAGLHNRPGTAIDIAVENQFVSDEPDPPDAKNHSQQTLTDALAVYSLLSQIDPALSPTAFKSILGASASGTSASLERIVDALETLYGINRTDLPTGNANRDALYQAIYGLQATDEFKALAGSATIRPLSDDDRATLVSKAKTDFGDFLAVHYLLPFALENCWGVLGTIHPDLYAKYEADKALTPEQRAAGEANFSDEYLADRAEMLIWKLKFNTKDIATSLTFPHEDVLMNQWQYFKDFASGEEIVLGKPPGGQSERNQILFGSDANICEVLTGNDQNDRIYSGAGSDVLDGGKGDDYLEGNADHDTLTGGEGRDTLYGGTGNDTLEGGKDNDLLVGGTGNDTYKLTSDDGWDWIVDSDGQGHIEMDGATLGQTEIKWKATNVWQEEVGGRTVTYSLYDRTENGETFKVLAIQGGSGAWVKRWQQGVLGINLPEAPNVSSPTPSVDRTIVGDLTPIDFDSGPDITYHYDDLHNVVVNPGQPQPGRNDILKGSAGNDSINGGGGMDDIMAGAGDDQVEGGAGSDGIDGGLGKDILQGGADSDVQLGGAGDDEVFADSVQTRTQALATNETSVGRSAVRGDWVDGGAGDDLVVGGADADVVLGGDGKDLLIGGAGNDNLWGDTTTYFAYLDWGLERQVEESNGVTHYKSVFTHAGTTTAAGSNDLIFGGSGDDWLLGDGGDDFIDGGADNDVAFGGQGDDQVLGATGDDVLSGDELDNPDDPGSGLAGSLHGNDYLDGGDGNDTLLGNGADDVLFGGDGDDEINGDDGKTPGQYHGRDFLDGGEGNDKLWGSGEDDELYGGDGNDHLEGDYSSLDVQYHGKDTLSGGNGNDELIGGGNDDELNGGEGNDTLVGDDTPDAPFSTDAHGNDTLRGEKGDDYLSGGGGEDLLEGGEGKDVLYGDTGNDSLFGGSNDDGLYGEAGNDLLIGGAGTDRLNGGDGDDTYRFASGDSPTNESGLNEVVLDESGNNSVVFEMAALEDVTLSSANNGQFLMIDYGAEDRLLIQGGFSGAVATYQFAGGERLSYSELIGRLSDGVNVTTTTGGLQVITGGRNDDQIESLAGGSTLSGGHGNDTLTGHGGSNTYLYSAGDGTDTIVDNSHANGFTAANTLRFGSGITPADISLGLGSLLIRVGDNPADAIHIEGFNPADVFAAHPIDRFEFADGSVLTYEQLLARGFDLAGTDGNDTIAGTSITDRISGGAGNDTLTGGEGGDTYFWGIGAGQDVIDNSDSAPAKTDVLQIGPGLRPEDLAFVRSVNDLIVRVRNSNDQVTVTNHFASAAIGSVAFSDGTIWGTAEIEAHLTNELTSGADIYSGTAGDDAINGLGGNDTLMGLGGNDTLIGGAGMDTLTGGAGSDTLDGRGDAIADSLQGGAGGDVYLFARGSGADSITEGGDTTSVDILRLDAGISPTDIQVVRSGTDVVFKIANTTDQIKVVGAYATNAGASSRIERIEFADGTAWGEAMIRQQILLGEATSAANTLNGFDGNDSINGLAGNDILYGYAGNDQLDGGEGVDTLYGGDGDDLLDGGGNAGGNYNYIDTLYGDLGSDTYVFRRGSGFVRIQESANDIAGNLDTVVFGPGISPGDIVLSLDNETNLLLVIKGTSDYLYVNTLFATQDDRWKVERFVFEDGTVWTPESIATKLTVGTSEGDTLTGFGWDDTIDGSGGSDVIYGNAGNDVLEGGDGNDTLYGDNSSSSLVGDDTLHGGAGNDVLRGGKGNDTYLFQRGGGNDSIYEVQGNDRIVFGAGILPSDITLFAESGNLIIAFDGGLQTTLTVQGYQSASSQIEQIEFVDGTVWDAVAIQSHTIAGAANAMVGTAGNDTYIVDNAGDTIAEGAGQGIDTVLTSVSYSLPTNVENITAAGYLNLRLYGNSLNNTIIGNSGNNYLSDGGGYDTLKGGLGNDNYVVSASSSVIELPNEGFDTISTTTSYTLPENVENLVLQNNYANLSGTGNALDNSISIQSPFIASVDGYGRFISNGNSIDGGAGADMMSIDYGGTFYVDNIGDRVSGSGVINVISSVDYALPESGFASFLTLTGSSAIRGTGNSGVNTLDGRQNDVANVLAGGAGDDTYYAGDNDVVLEQVGGGNDTLMVYAQNYGKYKLDIDNVENLIFANPDINYTADIEGSGGNNRLVGNNGQNSIFGLGGDDVIEGGSNWGDVLDGGDGNDTIYGSGYLFGGAGDDKLTSLYGSVLTGGIGNDRLTGQAQQDTYVFARGDGQDVILDYSRIVDAYGNPTSSVDTIDLVGDLNSNEIQLSRIGDDLVIAISGSSDQITVNKHFAANTASNSFQIDQIRFADGTVWTPTAIETRIARNNANTASELSDVFSGGSGNDTIQALGGDDLISGGAGDDVLEGGTGNDTLLGSAGNDTLQGGADDDTLQGGIGSDTYRFGRGAGVDTVIDPANAADIDTILIDSDVLPSQLIVRRSGLYSQDLTLSIVDDAAQIILRNFACKEVEFADGTIWDQATLLERATSFFGSSANDSLTGSATADRIFGLEGDDSLDGLGGGDRLDGGVGADTMAGGDDNDTYVVDDTGDVINESDSPGSGWDTVESSISYTLGANLEDLYLTGDAATTGTGNDLNNILTGNAAANILSGGTGADTMYGGLGDDVYLVDNVGDIISEDFGEGTDLVQASVTYALSADVENLVLTGTSSIKGYGNALDNEITGNSGANSLTGNAGNDTLDGGAGNDTMVGGAGDDTYVVDSASDVVTESANEGSDTVRSSVTLTLANNIENLVLMGGGTINGTGNTLNNTLVGNSAANTLNGSTGNDTLIGGAGSDIYVVDSADDVVVENVDEGIDLVQSSVTYSLSENLENLTLTGTSAINATGNTLGNSLIGNSGANILDGGAGADTLAGGSGNDTYVVDDTGDLVTEAASAGTDLVQSKVTYTLGINVESLTLTGSAAINGTGNTQNNTLTGNSGDNLLNGGTGADTLIGGGGDDTYVVDSASDVVTENANAGTDTVQSSVSYTLAANVENLTLTGTSAINGTGNAINNSIAGNSAANTLDGGTGADTLIGGAGNDTYVVDNVNDVVTENASEGTDLVKSSVTYTLAADVENLTLTGTTAINGTGNALNNVITGNTADNILDGGAGTDTLLGGTGNDTYYVSTGDTVTEAASAGTDTVISDVTWTLGSNLEKLTLSGTAAINGTGNSLANVLIGNSAANTLSGGTGADTLQGGAGDDIYVVDNTLDVVTENTSEGIDTVQSSVTLTLAANVEALVLTGTSAINGTGNVLNNLLRGNTGNNVLNGGSGNDVLEGGAGNDTLTDTAGTAFFNGGAGTDTLTGGSSAELYLGGIGNDTLTTGAGNDVILFNKGDGQDAFTAGGTGSDTISLGGAFAYSDLTLTKSSNDLVLKLGTSDQITFKDWYATTPSKPVVNLQVIAEAMADFDAGGSNPLLDQKVETFNFAGLVDTFDAARSANPTLTTWALTNALASFQLAGSDTAALGGDLAYQYGKNGALTGIGLTAAQDVIGNASFGTNAQTLQPLASFQTGSVRLS